MTTRGLHCSAAGAGVPGELLPARGRLAEDARRVRGARAGL